MKTIHLSVLLGTVALLLAATSAHATLIVGTDPEFGADSLTVDTQTELAWLNLSYTAGLSYNQVLADMQPGGMFSNYTFATSQEVTDLYADAGISGPAYYYLSWPAIGNLISLVGATGTINGEPGLIAVSGTSDGPGQQEAPAIYATSVLGTEVYFVSDGTGIGSTSDGDSTPYSDVGDWLVTTAPEPGIGSVAMAGLTALLFIRRLKTAN